MLEVATTKVLKSAIAKADGSALYPVIEDQFESDASTYAIAAFICGVLRTRRASSTCFVTSGCCVVPRHLVAARGRQRGLEVQ